MNEIFEILHHEDHRLEIVKYGNNHVLGCKQCGVDIISETEIISNLKKYKALLELLETRNENMYKKARAVGRRLLNLRETDIDKLCTRMIFLMEDHATKNHVDDYSKACKIINMPLEIQMQAKEAYRLEYDQLAEIVYKEYKDKPYEKLIAKIIDKLKTRTDKFSFYTKEEKRIAGCKVFKIEYGYENLTVMGLNEKLLKKLEERLSTPINAYTFKDTNDYFDRLPSWEDEEDETEKFLEHMYRLERDLYDFKNVNINEIIKDSISVFEDYDYTKRYTVVLNKFVLKK